MLARMRPSKPSYVGDMSPSATRWNAMAQVLLVSDIRRPTLQSDCKSSTETSWRCRKREAGRNRSITTSVGDKHGLPRQRELRGDRSSAMQRPHRHDRGPSGCLASGSPSLGDTVAHPDALRAKGRGLKWRRFSVAGDGRGTKGHGRSWTSMSEA